MVVIKPGRESSRWVNSKCKDPEVGMILSLKSRRKLMWLELASPGEKALWHDV